MLMLIQYNSMLTQLNADADTVQFNSMLMLMLMQFNGDHLKLRNEGKKGRKARSEAMGFHGRCGGVGWDASLGR